MKISNELKKQTDGYETSDEIISVISNLYADGSSWNKKCQEIWETGIDNGVNIIEKIYSEAEKIADEFTNTLIWGNDTRKINR